MRWTDNTKTVTTTGASGMLNQPNFQAKLNLSKTLLNPQPRPKGDIKSTLEAARQRRLAMEQRNSKEVEQVVIVNGGHGGSRGHGGHGGHGGGGGDHDDRGIATMETMMDDVANIDGSGQ